MPLWLKISWLSLYSCWMKAFGSIWASISPEIASSLCGFMVNFHSSRVNLQDTWMSHYDLGLSIVKGWPSMGALHSSIMIPNSCRWSPLGLHGSNKTPPWRHGEPPCLQGGPDLHDSNMTLQSSRWAIRTRDKLRSVPVVVWYAFLGQGKERLCLKLSLRSKGVEPPGPWDEPPGLQGKPPEFQGEPPGLHAEPLQRRASLQDSRSRIHERTISFRFLGIILRVLRLEVSVWIS